MFLTEFSSKHEVWRDAFGLYHREGGPAYTSIDGQQEYWIYGNRHRTDGPAIIHPNGHKEYWVNGKLHRSDGPAIIRPGLRHEWFINGVDITRDVRIWLSDTRYKLPLIGQNLVEFKLKFIVY